MAKASDTLTGGGHRRSGPRKSVEVSTRPEAQAAHWMEIRGRGHMSRSDIITGPPVGAHKILISCTNIPSKCME
jgi:hypothetical protein